MTKYRRRNYIINPAFQIKFSILVSILLFIISAVYPMTFYSFLTNLAIQLEEVIPNTVTRMEQQKNSIVSLFVMWHIGFTLLVFTSCIFFSHKIAGPLYKLKKYLQEYREGKAHDRLYFRKGDYFLELAEEVNLTFNQIKEKNKNDIILLCENETLLGGLQENVSQDKKESIAKAIAHLSKLQSEYSSRP